MKYKIIINLLLLFLIQLSMHAGNMLDMNRQLNKAYVLLLLGKDKQAFEEYMRLAKKENIIAQVKVGYMYYQGKGVKRNLQAAIRYLRKAAKKNDGDALLILGEIYYKQKDFKQATEIFKKAGSMHIPGACHWLRNIFSDKENPQYNPKKAEIYYSHGVNNNSEESAYLLAQAWVRSNRNLILAEDLLIQLLKKSPYNGEYLFEYSLLLCKQEKYKESLKQAQKALIYNPDDLLINFLLSDLYSKLKMFKKAKSALIKSLTLTEDSQIKEIVNTALLRLEIILNPEYREKLESKFRNAQKLWNEQKYKLALSIIVNLAKKEYSPAQLLLGLVYYQGEGCNKDFSQAKKWFKKAASQGQGQAFFALGEMSYLDDKDYALAIEYYKAAAKLEYHGAYTFLGCLYSEPENQDYSISLAEYYYKKGISKGIDECRYFLADIWINEGKNLAQAENLIREVQHKFKDHGKFVLLFARILLLREKHQEATEQFLNADKLMPNTPGIKEYIGDVYYKLKDYNSAKKYWEEAVTLANGDSDISENIEKKLENLSRLIENNKTEDINQTEKEKLADKYLQKASIYFNAKIYDKVIRDCNKVIKLVSGNENVYKIQAHGAYLFRGMTYRELTQYKKAIADLTVAIKFNPKYWGGYYIRGLTHAKLKQHSKAITDFAYASKLDPINWMIYYKRGLEYSYIEKYKEAIADFSHASKLSPDSEIIYPPLAVMYGKLKRYDKAVENYSRAINLGKNNLTLKVDCYLGIMEIYIIEGKHTQFSYWLKRFDKDIPEKKLPKGYLMIKLYLSLINKCVTNRPMKNLEKKLNPLLEKKDNIKLNWSFGLTDKWLNDSKNDLTPEQSKYIRNLTDKIKKNGK